MKTWLLGGLAAASCALLAAPRAPADGEAAADRKLAALVGALDTADRPKFERACAELRKTLRPGDLKALLEAGRDKRPRVRAGVVTALTVYGKSPPKDVELIVNFLLFRLKDEDPEVRVSAAGVSHWFAGRSSRLVAGLIKALRDPDAPKPGSGRTRSVSEFAAGGLLGAGKLARPAYRPLIRLAEEGGKGQRHAALQTIAFYAARDEPYQPLLVGYLIKQLESVKPVAHRELAASALGELRGRVRPVVPALRRAFRDASTMKDERARAYFRAAIVGAIEKSGAAGRPAIPDLIAALKDSKENRYVRERIIDFVAGLKEGRRYLPALRRIADDQTEHIAVRREALRAIKRIPPDPDRPGR